ncbi:hypothetical protein [Streptomyces gibsoniae]|uniref:Uncharacterized protein n=1 Tax=Streptomyces gibsoniae TaxID=3075529 RepID=A0ABU2TUQ8_9ACTN|nr:hypothetical protein [Streptomyces sp. DSM 41699]MDT0464566.1 hypothetical protein [Streptomyces sp. DSM 41699]
MALKERHFRQLLETATPLLLQGERVELTTFANVGSVSMKRRALTAAAVGVASMGTMIATVQPRPMYLILTDQRLLFFDCLRPNNKTGKLLMNVPRPYATVGTAQKGMFGLTLVTSLFVAGSERGLKLTFPAPCRPQGRELVAALPPAS